MTWLEVGEALFWFCLSVAMTVVGLLIALFGMWLNYMRGTKGGRTPLVCAILTAFIALLLWLVLVYADPPCALLFGIVMSLAAFMAFTSWFARYDRN